MIEFDCLDVKTQLEGKMFVEASAGTGKTFAIEHVVARLILQKFPIDQILITTFTNAGVRDLKLRIYQNLRKLVETDSPPPYLATFPKVDAILSLKNALRLIDEAQIFTIHSFCHRMLSEFSFEANIDRNLIDPEKGFRKETLELAALDVLRMIVDTDEFSPAQLTRLMNPFQKETKKFVRKMVSFLSGGPEIPEHADYKTLRLRFEENWEDASDRLLGIASSYNKTCNRSGDLHPFVREQIEALANKNFDRLITSSPSIFELFTEKHRKKSSSTETDSIIEALAPIIYEASDPFILFCRVAKKVQKRLEDQNEGPNILLETMASCLKKKAFRDKVSDKFKALIIDEFQDTDPLQWSIFSSLSPELLLVVGDPKQSIYAFRGADLQTFLNAKKDFSHIYKLSSNYRSDPTLIAQINKLFQIPSLFTEVGSGDDFSYQPLLAKKKPSGLLSEAPLEFVLSTHENEETLFSFIAQEIKRLGETLTFAILVKDRYEAFRLTDYLQNLGLSVLTTATANITEGIAFKFLYLASKLILSPKNMSLAKEILSHPFLGWPVEKVKDASEEEVLTRFIELSALFQERGLAPFFTELLNQAHVEIAEDYADLMQLICLILESHPESLHKYLEKLELLDADDHPYLKRRPLVSESKITIMTSHMSKGLEFDIVFCLGTASRYNPSPLKSISSQDLEKLRLFYVAATRAKEKLYLFVKITEKEGEAGTKAPIELLLEKLCGTQNPELTQIKKVLKENDFSWTEIGEPILIDKLNAKAKESKPPQIQLPPFPPKNEYQSFSSLITSHATSPVPKESELPPGPETGNLFHLLLEKIIETGSYFNWNENQMKGFIEKELFRTHLESLPHIVYDLLYTAFHTPLGNFSLHEVRPEYMLQEQSFLYQTGSRSYMKGFIDLTFLHNGHYYLLDWKLNLLTDYNPETLHKAMLEHSYYTQAQIYKTALEKALKDHPFGNTFYFFLRGKEKGLLKL